MSQFANGQAVQQHGAFQRFFHWEVAGSVVLLVCTVLALVWANSPWADSYFDLVHTYVGISWGEATFNLSLQHWINDGLMVVFFFVVGLEVKRELILGQLSSLRKAMLPVSAAAGGMIVPAAVYLALNAGSAGIRGWGVPMATDIAFALGILALFGARVPIGLKVFLTALAIADDIGAVLVIALFYTEDVRVGALAAAGVFLLLIGVANRSGIRRPGVYALLVVCVWVAVFASGVHATVAGILVAMMVPVRARIEPSRFFRITEENLQALRQTDLTQESMIADARQLEAIRGLHYAAADMRPPGLILEHHLHRSQAFVILPLFALFNAGVALDAGSATAMLEPVSLGIILGLFIGKQLGVTLLCWLVIRSGAASMPEGVSWSQIWGVSCLAGVGFTMALFISELAFLDPEMIAEAKIGILAASLISGVVGFLILRRALPS